MPEESAVATAPADTTTCRVLVADAVSDSGIALLRDTPGFDVTVKTGMVGDELAAAVAEHDALIVRSATKVTADVLRRPGRLRAIGRAGTGVDNIDLQAATRAGVVVMNTPGGNSVAAAELTMSLLLSMARNVAQANADLRAGRWERKKYMGTEVAGKTIGVVGLGRIGREVARRAKAFRMEVVGYDPFVSAQAAESVGIRALPLEEVLAQADFLTLHLPATAETKHMIDEAALCRMKPGARIINCARGGLIDEAALLTAIESGRIAGAALDVFEQEPPTDSRLVEHPHVVSTPHLGASTREAQERVGTEIADKVRQFLQSGVILDAVNFPAIDREEFKTLGPVMDLAERLGRLVAQIATGGQQALDVRAQGSFADKPLRPIAMAAVKGALEPALADRVSRVNALQMAEERGVTVDESRSNEPSHYAGLLTLTLRTDGGTYSVAGTVFADGRPRLVELDGAPIESTPDGHLLLTRNHDVPGVVGKIGGILGRAGVNIAGIQLGRLGDGREAVAVINVDQDVPSDALAELRAIEEIISVKNVTI